MPVIRIYNSLVVIDKYCNDKNIVLHSDVLTNFVYNGIFPSTLTQPRNPQ